MTFITVVKKIGEKILSVVEYPIKHSVQLAEMLVDFEKDEPKVKTAIVGLVEQFEALGPEVAAAIAAKGVNFAADAATVAGVESLFGYFVNTFLPAVEAAYADFKTEIDVPATAELATASPTPPTQPADAGTDALQGGPGLHNVVPA